MSGGLIAAGEMGKQRLYMESEGSDNWQGSACSGLLRPSEFNNLSGSETDS